MFSGLEICIGASVTGVAFYRVTRWIADSPITSNPWGDEIEREINQPNAMEACHRCSTPQSPTAWFCPHCGSAVGPYNNLMPYVCVFSEGEVLRNGVMDKMRVNTLTIAGYILYSLGSYWIFAPVFWFFLFRHLRAKAQEPPENVTTVNVS